MQWTVALQPGRQYARITAGPNGPTANQTAAFNLQVRLRLFTELRTNFTAL